MSLKLVFNNEIHRVSKLPVSITALIQSTSLLFNGTLPATWGLQYLDSEGDKVMLRTEEDFQALLSEASQSSQSIKVYITSDGNFEKIDDAKSDDFQIVQKEDVVEMSLPVEQPLVSQAQEPLYPVLNTNRDNVEIVAEKKEKPWMKFVNVPKFQALRLHKKLRDENIPGEDKVIILQEFDQKRNSLTEDDKQWLDKKILKQMTMPHCDKPKKSDDLKNAVQIFKRTFDKEITPEEKEALNKQFDEAVSKLNEAEKNFLLEKKAKITERRLRKSEKHEKHHEKREKREKRSENDADSSEKKLKFADAFSKFIKTNIQNVADLIGDQFQGKPHCREMKQLIEELCLTFCALPEQKQAEVSSLLNGVPDKMVALMKIRQQKKEEKKLLKESMKKNSQAQEEQKFEIKQDKKQEKRELRRLEKEQKEAEKAQKKAEKTEKSKSPKKEKSPEKKPVKEIIADGLLKGVTTVTSTVQDAVVAAKEAISKKKYAPGVIAKANQIKEVFPDADIDAVSEFVKQHYNLTIEQLIDEFLQNYKN